MGCARKRVRVGQTKVEELSDDRRPCEIMFEVFKGGGSKKSREATRLRLIR